ncbi:hypothetical protein D5086_011922 [Populus alba]|uniref:Uncharacterized protein n=1 Tax=Populus alba TaxID=43335 RepID=A0ACC4C0P6_POPAL
MLVPAEIITDILSRLPVRTLKRFRCVSKSWCKETESPYFINMHLQKLTQARTNLGLILGDRSSTRLYPVNLDKPNPTSSMELIAVHWTASTEIIRRDLSPTMIVAFGFGVVEGFRIIAKPADYLANEHHYFDLGVLGGCLCLLCAKMCSLVQIYMGCEGLLE